MAQQTINIGASPNDGTGTPLRTAFQYTNSNFSELYTAVGPSGNNIVVPGNATITGDLTVDTSTLKVDSANDRVGVGTASPAQFVHLSKSNTSTALTAPPVGGASLRIQNTSSTNNNFGSVEFYNAAGLFGGSVNCQFTNQATPTNDLVFVTRGSSGGLEHYRIAADGVCTWSEVGGVAGTAMTLNATGLGVGGSIFSNSKLTLVSGAGVDCMLALQKTGGSFTSVLMTDGTNGWLGSSSGSTGKKIIYALNAPDSSLTIDSAGNVGIGVTPSAWTAGFKALQVGAGTALWNNNVITRTSLTTNYYYGGSDLFIGNGYAHGYWQDGANGHRWFTSSVANASGAGASATMNQTMTLDASGRLILLASTTTPATLATNGQLTFTATSNTNLRFSYRGSDGVTRTADLTLA